MNDFSSIPRPKHGWYMVILSIARTAFFLFGGLNVLGRENIPLTGPVIIAPNHMSHADPPAVACASHRDFFFMAKEELFKGWFGKLIFSVGSFPVRRDSNDTESIRKAIAILENGGALVVFPEGSRGDGKSLGPLNKGVALLAKKTGALVVPVGVNGTQNLLPKGGAKVKRSRVQVSFGPPFKFEDAGTGEGKISSEQFCQALEARLIEETAKVGLTLAPHVAPASKPDAVANLE